MGVGRDLGHQLRRWLEQDPEALRQSRALTNRLMDGLGAEESLRAPLRDLASPRALARCERFFIELQQVAADWLSLTTTKTGAVYRLKGNPPQAHE